MALSKADRLIADLVTALDLIRRHAKGAAPSLDSIRGVADFAIEQANAERERNSDGYLVVKP